LLGGFKISPDISLIFPVISGPFSIYACSNSRERLVFLFELQPPTKAFLGKENGDIYWMSVAFWGVKRLPSYPSYLHPFISSFCHGDPHYFDPRWLCQRERYLGDSYLVISENSGHSVL
jgi:hypothetical protein